MERERKMMTHTAATTKIKDPGAVVMGTTQSSFLMISGGGAGFFGVSLGDINKFSPTAHNTLHAENDHKGPALG
jgi:hypothetical protein